MSQKKREHKTYVMKFGGSSLAGPIEILQTASIIKKYASNSNLVIVCSAMGDTTDHLLKAVEHAKKGETNLARAVISKVHQGHMAAVSQCISEQKYKDVCRDWIAELFDEIDKVLLGISLLRDLSPRSMDYILSFGERLATFIVSNALASMGLKTKYLSGGEAGIMTDETFGSAEPVLKVTNEKLRSRLLPLIADGIIPVVTGYIAETLESHELITLGRGGSDYTATLIAAAIDADEIVLWTDVDGMLSADPRIIKNAKILEQVTYLEAMEMSAFGAKSMQPRALEPAARKGIAVRIRNTFNPSVGWHVDRFGEQDCQRRTIWSKGRGVNTKRRCDYDKRHKHRGKSGNCREDFRDIEVSRRSNSYDVAVCFRKQCVTRRKAGALAQGREGLQEGIVARGSRFFGEDKCRRAGKLQLSGLRG